MRELDEINTALSKAFLPKDQITNFYAPLVINTGGKLVVIDTGNGPGAFATNPGWHLMFDQDPAQAEATRRKVYDMLVADKMRVQGFHYPFPANGFVEKDGSGYRLVPAPWSPVI